MFVLILIFFALMLVLSAMCPETWVFITIVLAALALLLHIVSNALENKDRKK